jgi:hypothetical protein
VASAAGAELKENPRAEVIVAGGELRLMMLGLDGAAADGACMFAPKAEDDAMADEAKGETNAPCDGLKAGAGEQTAPDTVTVVAESNRTVLTPSGPIELKVDVLSNAPGFGVAVGRGVKDDEAAIPPKAKLGVPEEDKEVDEGTIPPKLNVLVGGKELNWRLIRLMTGGGVSALRLMTDEGDSGALGLMTDGLGEGAGGLRLMTGGPCGPAIRPTPVGLGLFRRMMLDDGAGGLRLMTGGPCGPAMRPTPVGLGLFRRMTLDDGAGFMPSG